MGNCMGIWSSLGLYGELLKLGIALMGQLVLVFNHVHYFHSQLLQ